MSTKVGIVGCGFVGGAMYANFKGNFDVNIWDTDEEKRTVETIEDFVRLSDIIFVCVPTPMKSNGECDTSIVESVVEQIAKIDKTKFVVIKSTVVPGTTAKLSERYGIRIGFNPEFLTEANSIKDFRDQELIVIGADDTDIAELMDKVYRQFGYVTGNSCHVIRRTTKEAELFKYLANCFLATKVMFANEFKILCDNSEVDYNRIAELAMLDSRLGKTHWRVPGPDGKLGFGGSCFPKDTAALLSYADDIETSLWLLTEASYINENLRNK
jgi:UDPglucose 6-dehydrogenase